MTLPKKLQYKIEYYALALLTSFVGLLPLETAASISASVWRYLGPKNRRHKRALANLTIAFPEKTDAEREAIALEMWDNMGRVMVETMMLDKIVAKPTNLNFINHDLADRYSGKLGPGVCLSLHTGNWELASWPMLVMKGEPAAVYRTVKNPYVDNLIRQKRVKLYPGGMFGKTGIQKGSEMKIARALNQFVRDGGRVGMLGDLHFNGGVKIPFFGKDAPTNPFPGLLARRYGCRLWLGRAIRKGKTSNFNLEIKELHVPVTDDKHADIKNINLAIHRQFEEWIREYPEQWMWSNRRWS